MSAYETTEVWFRNPDAYIRELVEVGVGNIAWDRGLLHKRRIDPKAHADLYFGKSIPYRLLLIGEQGTADIRPDSTLEKPTAVYPTWCFGEEQTLLEELCRLPVGEDMEACLDQRVETNERPVWGQEHRVIISDMPNVGHGVGRKFLRYLKELQEEYPKCILHVHGMWSHRLSFGMGFAAADTNPREAAQKGRVIFPSGNEEKYEKAQANPKWVTILGFNPVDLEIPRNRCMYNIKSAMWAGENFNSVFNFQVRPTGPVDSETPDDSYVAPVTKSHMTGNAVAKTGDKQLCDTCSLAPQCKYFRDGSVCTVPGAEPKKLAEYFQSRNADVIIDGLGTLVAAGSRRLERGLHEENAFGDTNPEVTKMLNQLFGQGVQLAKLIDPTLAGGARVNVNVGVGAGGAAMVSTANPKQMVAQAFRELEAQGIPRKDITPEMIQGLLTGLADPGQRARAIEGTVVSREDS